MTSDSPNTADIVERLALLLETHDECNAMSDAIVIRVDDLRNLLANTPDPEAAAIITELRELVFESLYHLRTDARAEAYHNKASAALKDHRKAQAHD